MDDNGLTREERELLESGLPDAKQHKGDLSDAHKGSAGKPDPLNPPDVRRQLEVLEAFHHSVADRFADVLSRGLQQLVEVRLADASAMTYSQFAFSRSKPTCYVVLQATPLPTSLAIDLSPSLLYPILDTLLGGGKQACPIPDRAPTELEQRLAKRVIRLLLDELHDAWEPLLAVDLSIDRVENDAQRVRVVAPGEDVVALTFETRVADQTGNFTLCLPQRAIRKIVDKLLVGELTGSEAATLHNSPTADSVELTAYFTAESLSQVELQNLREGDVLLTDVDADGPVQVSIDGETGFEAHPGSLHGRRAIVFGPKTA